MPADQLSTVGLQAVHAGNGEANLNVTMKELTNAGRSHVVATCVRDLAMENLVEHQNFNEMLEGRLVLIH